MCEIELFFGCYLLVSRNERYKGSTYIGFTNNPTRREGQHNKGKEAGGAWKTSGRGPWDMALIVHGFPNEISALQFEWAWQNPEKSRHLRKSKQNFKKSNSRTNVAKRLQVMMAMLNVAPWKRLPLTIRWLCESYRTVFQGSIPAHIPITYGRVKTVKPKKKKTVEEKVSVDLTCFLCQAVSSDVDFFQCYWPECSGTFHILCMAKHLLSSDRGSSSGLLPVNGNCPVCQGDVLWGDLVRYKHGCYRSLIPDHDSDIHESQF